MVAIAAVRQAEPWSLANIVGGVVVLLVVVIALVWLLRRYLDT